MVYNIDTIDGEALAPYRSLTEAQLRNRLDPSRGIFIAESPNVIMAALDAGCRPLSLLTERRHLEGTAKDIVMRLGDEVPVYTGERELLASLTGYELTRGVLCAMRRPAEKSCGEVCRDARRIAVIDAVVNATNTGTIFRAAAALGIDGVLLSSTCSDPLNRRCVRVSMGTVFQVPWAWLDNTLEEGGIEWLKRLGFGTIAMALADDALPIDSPLLKQTERIAIVLGNEGCGLSQEVVAACDHVAKIPMQRGVDSLNVAAAAAVAFWELGRDSRLHHVAF